jgi:hypothetical protein
LGAQAGSGHIEKQAQDDDDVHLATVALVLLRLIGFVLCVLVGWFDELVNRRLATAL